VPTSKYDDLLDELIGGIAAKTQEAGFVRRHRTLRARANGNVAIINFQKSDQSSDDRILFTVNLGVVCGALLDLHKVGENRVDVVDAHLRTRLGMLLDDPGDRWWGISESTDLEGLRAELSRAITEKAVPYLQTYSQTHALAALWHSGKSPGLTAVQRARYLAQLES
jgi:hypothetical protein